MNRRVLFAAIALLIAVACGSDKTVVPTNPSNTTPAITPVTTPSSLVMQGPLPASVGPGDTAQLTVIARFIDGTERNVTADATWASTQPQIASVNAGVITGKALGRTVIRATYSNRSTSLTIVVEPAGTFIVSGFIVEPGSISVPLATVAVLASPTYQVTASSTGFYELFGLSGTVMLRVSKPGYVDENPTFTVTDNKKYDVQIRPITPPAPIAGIYRMTLTISPSCSIVPDDQKTRTYTATIGQDNARLKVQLSDANFVSDRNGTKNTFTGQESASTVTFNWGDSYYVYYYGATVQEILSGGQTLGIWGTMVGSAAAQTISGNLAGGFTYRDANGRSSRGCSASDNKVVLTKLQSIRATAIRR